jgi:hypothetical protein
MATTTDEPLPLHELISRILAPEPSFQKPKGLLAGLGTMQALNQRLANQPLLDFINATLRGISQVIFVNNPLSGLLILAAMFIQSPWLGGMSLVGTAAATLMAIAQAIYVISSMQLIAIAVGSSQPRSWQLTCIRQENSSLKVN